MENYKLLQRLGRGAQGCVYLAENRTDGKKYVLKKIECNDESEANKAFKEALALQELKHPYVCAYKEFFVTWDKEECAMFVCIVMEHYKMGDLRGLLTKEQDTKEPLDEMAIKKWLGQIIEALVFVHKKNVIHRDLKPSNIFVMEDLSLCIGDFGVSTIVSDAHTKTRTAVGSMNWMAPEVLEQPYDERSDVWSLGCIALELVTCATLDSSQMASKLYEIKHSIDALEQMLEEVSQVYSPELVAIIRMMLQRDFSQRPTAEQLVEIPYMRECLALGGSILAERKKRQNSAPPQGSLPRDRGIIPVMEYLRDNITNESCVKQSLQYLAGLVKEDEATLDRTSKLVVVKAMRDYISEVDIQVSGCSILNSLIITGYLRFHYFKGIFPISDDVLYSAEVISAIPLAMKSHSSSSELQQAAAALLMALSADEGAAEVIGSTGGLQDLLAAMRNFPDNAQLCATCCGALWSLTVNEDNARIMTEEKGLRDIVKTIEKHFRVPELMEAACATLLSLSIVDENLEEMVKLDCAGLLLQAIDIHKKEAKVVKNACMALASLIEPDEESAFRVLCNKKADGGEVAGIPIVIAAYEQHKDNTEVVEGVMMVLVELTEYEEILAELKFLRLHETVLHDVHKRFKDNTEIMTPCETALSKMGVSRVSKRAGIK